jgi:hypothetical protein
LLHSRAAKWLVPIVARYERVAALPTTSVAASVGTLLTDVIETCTRRWQEEIGAASRQIGWQEQLSRSVRHLRDQAAGHCEVTELCHYQAMICVASFLTECRSIPELVQFHHGRVPNYLVPPQNWDPVAKSVKVLLVYQLHDHEGSSRD